MAAIRHNYFFNCWPVDPDRWPIKEGTVNLAALSLAPLSPFLLLCSVLILPFRALAVRV
jgi:hypothetical protein